MPSDQKIGAFREIEIAQLVLDVMCYACRTGMTNFYGELSDTKLGQADWYVGEN